MKKNEPAFPMKEVYHTGLEIDDEPVLSRRIANGLTKREYFAGLAMQGILSFDEDPSKHIAVLAVKQADALIKELEKTDEEA